MKSKKPVKNRYKGALRPGSENYMYGGYEYMYGGEYAKGGWIKDVGSFAYGTLEGTLDTLTMGLTDPLTDKGYDALQKVGNKKLDLNDPKDLKELEDQNKFRGAGEIAGAITGSVVNPAAAMSGIGEGLEGANRIIQNSDVSDKTRQIANISTQIGSTATGIASGSGLAEGIAPFAKTADQLDTWMNIGQGIQVGSQFLPQGNDLASQGRAIQAENDAIAGLYPNANVQYYGNGGKLSNKIGKLRRERYPQDQAVAIAYSMQKRNKLEDGGELDKKETNNLGSNPEGQDNLNIDYTQDKQNYIDYLQSDQYKIIATKNWGDQADEFIQKQIAAIGAVEFKPMSEIHPGMQTDALGLFHPGLNTIYTTEYNNTPIMHHELSHATDANKDVPDDWFIDDPNYGPKSVKNPEYFIYKDIINEYPSMGKEFNDWSYIQKNPRASSYLKDPSEMRARVNAVRINMIKNGINIQDLTPETLNNYINDSTLPKDIRSQLSDLYIAIPDENERIRVFKELAYNEAPQLNSTTTYAKYGGKITSSFPTMQERNKLEDGGPTMLPTVEVTADKYTGEDINKAYPYYNTLSAEERKLFRDSSPIGAQIRSRARNGQGVNTATMDAAGTALLNQLNPITALQAPQSLMVEGVEALRGNEYNFANALQADKQRLPSETMGFQTTDDMSWYNPNVVGNFVLDMMADPTNIVGAGLLKSGVKGAAKTAAKTGTNVVEGAINSTDNLVSSIDNVTPKPWQVQELPGLHLKSTMEGGAISKIIEPKTGLINTEQALAIIAKESGGADKVALIKQGLGDNIPKKMDYNEFRKVVQDQLIPLERQFATRNSNYGIDRLGYTNHRTNHKDLMDKYSRWIKEAESEIVSGKFSGSHGFTPNSVQESIDLYKKQSSIIPIENQTIILSNKSKFGKGSSAHNNPEETLGHIHFLRDAETPDVLTVTQIQSDAFQGRYKVNTNYKEELKNAVDEVKFYKEQVDKLNEVGITSDTHLQLYKNAQNRVDELSNINTSKRELLDTQKNLLDKNHQERYLQELVDYAGKRGDVNKVRVPTSETAAKVQGYQKKIVGATEDWAGPMSNKGKIIEDYSPEHQTILKKYSQQPKTIKKLFGKEPTIVTDSKGNTWYEFDIPDKFKKGKGEIKAFTVTPIGIGLGINELQNNALSQPSKKGMGGIMNINSSDYNFYQDGGSMVLARPGEREYDFSSPLAFIKSVAEIRGVPVEDYINMLEKIGVHESTTLNTTTKQVGGGPGKGAYQVESESIPTAKGRVNNIFKNYNNGVVPDWATPIYESEDLLDLNTLLQTALTAADVLYRDNFNIANALESDENLITEWAKGYQTENDPAQMEDFRRDLKAPNYQRLKGTTQARLIELNKEYSDADVLGTQQKAAIDEMNMAAPNMGYVPTALDNTYVSPTMDYSSIVQDAAIPAMHKVEAGQTLSGIANQYNTTVEQLKQANPNIKSIHSIQIGQDINIPFQKAMGGMIDKNVMMQDLYAKGGLFDNMWAKRKRGEAPAKPGDKDYPDAKAWKAAIASTRAMGGEMYANGGSFDNPGFRALPAEVQAKIKGNAMAYGGNMNAQDMADAIINAPKGTYSSDIIKKARVAKNFAKAYGGNMYAYGGELPYSFEMGGEMLQTIDNGGTHEENPNGGVPATPDGMNLVEEGETVMNGNFVFSNRLKVTPEIAREFNLGKKAIGKTYADVSKTYKDDERPNDRFINRANERTLDNLAEAQESYKAVEQAKYEQDAMEMQDAVMQQQMMEAQQQQMQEPIDPNNPMVRSQIAQMQAIQQQQAQEMQQAMPQQGMAQGQPMMPQQQMGYGGKMMYRKGGDMDIFNQLYTPDNYLPRSTSSYTGTDVFNQIYTSNNYLPLDGFTYPKINYPTIPTAKTVDLPSTIPTAPGLPTTTPKEILANRNDFNLGEYQGSLDSENPLDPSTRRRKIGEALSYAPAVTSAAGMIQAMRDKVPYLQAAQTNIRFDQPAMDMTQARADAATAMRTGQRGAAAGSRGSVGTYLDATERITGATARGLGQTAMQQQMYNRQLEQQANQLAYQQAARNAQARMGADEFNIAGETAKTDRILEMMASAGQNIGNIGIDMQNREMVNQMPLLFDLYGKFKEMLNTGDSENPNG